MGSTSIDDETAEPVQPQDRDGTDLPSVIAKLGRKLARRSSDTGPAAAPGKRPSGT